MATTTNSPARKLPAVAWWIAASCAALMIWIGAESDDFHDAYSFTGKKIDYYNLLVSGFEKGHLYMDIGASPGLESKDPKVREQAPTLLDAGYFHGRFYIYYGVVPAALLLLPFHLLTGQFMGLNAACAAFWLVGFAASLLWLRSLWRDHAREGGAGLASILVLVLAFFPATTFLVRRSMFYELPIVAGYAFLSVCLGALYEASRGRRIVAMVALASLSAGLAVGCHPNHIFLLPILAWLAAKAGRAECESAVTRVKVVAAALFPAAVVGTALAWYNFARFGDIFEFGFKYGQNRFFSVSQSVFEPKFLGLNLDWYCLTPPSLAPYFPFVFPGNNTFRRQGYEGAEAMHGQLPATLLAIWIGIGLVALWRWPRLSAKTSRYAAVLTYAALSGLLFISVLQIRANRYLADSATPMAWIAAAACLWIWLNLRRGWVSKLWKAGAAVLVVLGSAFYVLASLQQFDQFKNSRPVEYQGLSRALNIPYRLIYPWAAPRPGLLVMKVRFERPRRGVVEPLVTQGTPGYTDSVYVAQHPDNLVQFEFDHKGYGGPVSALLDFDYTKEHLIEISMGSFYPPAGDRYMERFGAFASQVKMLAFLRLDGKIVINTSTTFYDTPPWSRQLGANATTETEFARRFRGTIESAQVVSIEPLLENLALNAGSGLYRYQIRFPEVPPLSGLPLLGIGLAGDGSLVFAKAEGGANYRIEMDDWGYGTQKGSAFVAAPGDHVLQIVLGPLLYEKAPRSVVAKGLPLSDLKDRLVVCLDGRILGDFEMTHHLDKLGILGPGANPQGFSTAEPVFHGLFEQSPMTDSEVLSLLDAVLKRSPHH